MRPPCPGYYDDDGTIVLSVTLDSPGTSEALRVLARYDALAIATLTVAGARDSASSEQTIALLRSRAAIEQAKGAIIAARRCDPDEAWATLRRTSQYFNVKLRDLAAALVEHLSSSRVDTPDSTPAIVPPSAARHAAERLWAAFAEPGDD